MGHARDDDFPEPPRLRRLRQLVTALIVTLIAGVIAIVALLALRLSSGNDPVALPPEVRLPAGETAGAVTLGDGWLAVVTTDGTGQQRIRVLDRTTGASRGAVDIGRVAAE
jgi:Family of unknown function (DUF6476)